MKKILIALIAFCLAFFAVSCTQSVNEKVYRLGVVDGAPTLAVANVLGGKDYFYVGTDRYKVEVDLVGGAQNIKAGLFSGDYDMAIAPLNLAATLYNAKPELNIKLASVNIFGCLYVIGDKTVENMSQYKGKTVVSVGAGGTPDVIFRNLLTESGIEINSDDENDFNKVSITYAADAAGVMAALKKSEADYAVLGEPAATTLSTKLGKVIAMDIQSEWLKVHDATEFVQAGLFLAGEAATNSVFVSAFLEKLEKNADFIAENKDRLSDVFANADSTLKSVTFTDDLIKRCNVGLKRASDVKTEVVTFLTALKAYNPAQIGGKLPGDDFYL